VQAVTHTSTNTDQHKLTLLIGWNTLPLRYTTNPIVTNPQVVTWKAHCYKIYYLSYADCTI